MATHVDYCLCIDELPRECVEDCSGRARDMSNTKEAYERKYAETHIDGSHEDDSPIRVNHYGDGSIMLVQGSDRVYVSLAQLKSLVRVIGDQL